jgi:hypothetical protein
VVHRKCRTSETLERAAFYLRQAKVLPKRHSSSSLGPTGSKSSCCRRSTAEQVSRFAKSRRRYSPNTARDRLRPLLFFRVMTSQDDTESVNCTHWHETFIFAHTDHRRWIYFLALNANDHPLWRFSGRAVRPGLLRTPRLGPCGSAAADCVDRLDRTAHTGHVASLIDVLACALLPLRQSLSRCFSPQTCAQHPMARNSNTFR